MKKSIKVLDVFIKTAFVVILYSMAAFFVYSVFTGPIKGESYIGSFDDIGFNDGWDLTFDGERIGDITLPYRVNAKEGMVAELTNVLPDTIKSGMRMRFHSARQDVTVYVDGEERGSYRADNFDTQKKKIPSSYFLINLLTRDAGKEIKVIIKAQNTERSVLGEVTYAYGNNVWFPLISKSLLLIVIAINLVVVGIATVFVYFFIQKRITVANAILYLAETMIVTGLWMMSESRVRQLIIRSPFYSSVYAYVFVAIIAVFAGMFINETQKNKYRVVYLILETGALIQVVVNTVLNLTNIVEYHDTLALSHVWSVGLVSCAFVTIIIDIVKKRIKTYSLTAIGFAALIVSSLLELTSFYQNPGYTLGGFIGIGLIVLLVTTILQVVRDSLRKSEERRLYSEKMNRATFRTIAGAIDAKDSYTGGHSERVGDYARLIAERTAKKYSFKPDDCSRIHYIGKMHDIGKVGVPDSVLNKAGKLTDEEFDLMKQHTLIGADILKNIDNIPGLLEGVRNHHERYDGKGYPDGLKGEEISIFARILCLADCFDAMTSDRVYRKRLSREQVIEEIKRNRGTQFDPYLADVVLEMIEEGVLEC
ncbi:MAG: HD-GYP domain-containing protein [Lachnospiraceae bacterium]|nr:HD-GYP domain-containing protein [Lachnospiraceae bacterium]